MSVNYIRNTSTEMGGRVVCSGVHFIIIIHYHNIIMNYVPVALERDINFC